MTALSLAGKPGIELLSVSWFDFSEMEIVYTCVVLVILTPCITIQEQKQEGKKDALLIKLTKAVHNIYLVVIVDDRVRSRLDNRVSFDKARFKRRISHVPNLTRQLNTCEVRRLNQLNSTV